MAFYPNRNLDYRTRIEWAPVADSGAFSSTSILGVVRFPYGIPYVPNVAGFEVQLECADPVYGTFDTTLKITTPGTDYTDTDAGAVDKEVWCYFDDVQISVDPDCDSWAFSADKIGFYGDEARTIVLLELTSFTDSGTGYDRRDLVQHWSALVATALPTPGTPVPGCTPFDTSMSSAFADCFWEVSAVGEENWIRKELEEYPIETPETEAECSCADGVPGIAIDEVDFDFGFVATFRAGLTLTEVQVPCPCIVPIEDPPLIEDYTTRRGDWYFESKGVNFYPAPIDFKLTTLNIAAQATEWCCEGEEPPPVEETDTVTGSKTYTQLTVSVLKSEGVKWCPIAGIQYCSNGLPFGGTCAGPDECCSYYAEHSAQWSYRGCPEPQGNCIDTDFQAGLFIYARSGVPVAFAKSDNVSPLVWTELDLDFDANCLSVRFLADHRILLVYEWGGVCYRTVSTNEGGDWSMAVTIGNGLFPELSVAANNDQFVYRVDSGAILGKRFDHAGNLLGSEFTAVASGVDDAGLSCDERTLLDGNRQILLTYISSGSVVSVISDDGINFS